MADAVFDRIGDVVFTSGAAMALRTPVTQGDRLKPSKGEQQRAAIVRAVRELLEETPITDLTVGHIAQRAGCTRTVFYTYFENKYSVLAVCLAEANAELNADVFDLGERKDGESFEDYFLGLIARAAIVNEHHVAVLNACVQSVRQDRQLAAMTAELLSTYVDRLAGLLPPEVREGSGARSLDELRSTLRMLIGLTILAGQNLELVVGGGDRQEEAVRRIARIWARTLSPE